MFFLYIDDSNLSPMLDTECSLLVIVVNGLLQIGTQHRRVLVSVHHSHFQALQGGLVALRKAAGLSQEQLAERLGVGQSYISKIERGDVYVDVVVFVAWCQASGVRAGHTLNKLFTA